MRTNPSNSPKRSAVDAEMAISWQRDDLRSNPLLHWTYPHAVPPAPPPPATRPRRPPAPPTRAALPLSLTACDPPARFPSSFSPPFTLPSVFAPTARCCATWRSSTARTRARGTPSRPRSGGARRTAHMVDVVAFQDHAVRRERVDVRRNRARVVKANLVVAQVVR